MTHQHQSMIDKTARIVFASNVPMDVTEDKIKEVFFRIGPILSFRVICDKDPTTGKSKCYTICEYKDQETALIAVKSLNNFEMAGRQMKVDHAFNEKTRLEMISVMQNAQNADSQNSEKTPETISKAVASLPPEQMFELLKQMKQCVQNNPGEAKNMLLQNPQLAYALLQALVVMRVVDPEIAVTALNNASTSAIINSTSTVSSTFDSNMSASSMINRLSSSMAAACNKPSSKIPATFIISNSTNTSGTIRFINNNQPPVPPPAPSIPSTSVVPPPAPIAHGDSDLRTKSVPVSDHDKTKAPILPADSFKRDPRLQNQNVKTLPGARTPIVSVPTPVPTTVVPNTLRGSTATSSATGVPTVPKPAVSASTPDNEKAALIMQVLRLTDAQIAMLPPEQRQSIMLLKEQIAKSAKR